MVDPTISNNDVSDLDLDGGSREYVPISARELVPDETLQNGANQTQPDLNVAVISPVLRSCLKSNHQRFRSTRERFQQSK